ncbi:hypothetical protein Q1695_012378 [Nippostrongylus brasiliensis]|nr:hypothetical protein Q1695_012378 [Nippostrongylus brasiliensis]
MYSIGKVSFPTSATHDRFGHSDLMVTFSFVIAYITSLYLMVLLIYISNLMIIVVVFEMSGKLSTSDSTGKPRAISPRVPTRSTQDESSANKHNPTPRVRRSSFYIDATQDQGDVADRADKRERKGVKKGGMLLHTQQTEEGMDELEIEVDQQKKTKNDGRSPNQQEPAPQMPFTPPNAQPDPKGQFPRAPKGHHVEELQEMEDILNEMTLPYTTR